MLKRKRQNNSYVELEKELNIKEDKEVINKMNREFPKKLKSGKNKNGIQF